MTGSGTCTWTGASRWPSWRGYRFWSRAPCTPCAAQLHAASRIGNYVIEGEIGKGGMGKVYRAQHSMIRRPTALKVMESQADRTLEALARFEREVQLSATLSHPNTITIYDFGRSEDATFYYVMEYLEGMDLQRLVEKFGPLPPERTAFILRQVCGSLAEAHSRGIIHRDLKPSNIFLTELGGLYDFVKVLDFGLAKQMHPTPDDVLVTQVGQVFGTPLFMAPETAAEAPCRPQVRPVQHRLCSLLDADRKTTVHGSDTVRRDREAPEDRSVAAIRSQ